MAAIAVRLPHLAFGPYLFDPNSRVLSRAGVELPVPPRVIGVLEALLRRAGDVVPRQELIDNVWRDAFVTDTSLAEAVSALRQALGDDPQAPTYVQTLHRRGYRFVAPVVEAAGDGRAAVAAPAATTAPPIASPSIVRVLLPWSAAAIATALAIIATWHAGTNDRSAPPPAIARFSIALPAGTTLDARASALALSADAATLAWSGCDATGCRLYVRRIESLEPAVVPGTESATAPFFSPDGRWLGFFADGKLKKVPIGGGAATSLADAVDPLGAVWTDRREIIYAGSAIGGLMKVSENGGDPSVFSEPRADDGDFAHIWPALTPSRDLVVFTILSAPGASHGRLAARRLDASSSEPSAIVTTGVETTTGGTPGVMVFSRGDELQAAWFDRPRLSIANAAPFVVQRIARTASGAHATVSTSGALLTASPVDAPHHQLRWLRDGGQQDAPVLNRSFRPLTLSPDGSRVAGVEAADGIRSDIWVADLVRGTTTRVTHDGDNTAPVWSGSAIYYASRTRGAFEIRRKDADATGAPVRVYGSSRHAIPVAAVRNGSTVAFFQRDSGTRSDLWLLDVASGRARSVVATPFDETRASFSPDGGLLAYQGSDAGRWEVYVVRLADGKRSVVSRGGGTQPLWSADGNWLYYVGDRRLTRAAVSGAGELRIGAPQEVAAIDVAELIGIDRSQRILIRRPPPQPTNIVLALEWTRELRQRLGPPPAFVPR
jgi:eukaryotic-like serine/threonine-protein kinase